MIWPQVVAVNSLTGGCSFTAGAWERHFNNYTQHFDISYPGAGNRYIADSIIHFTTQKHYDLVLIMWSGLTRLDTPVSDTSYFKDYFNVSLPNMTPAGTRYVMSGGEYGNYLDHPLAKMMYSNIYKFTSYSDLALMSLTEMIKLQNHLKTRGIPYYFMSYINYWNRPADWVSKNCDRGLNNYGQLKPVIDQLDFDQWIFLNDNKDGIFELAEQHNSFMDDRYHPADDIHKMWFDIVLERVVRDGHLVIS